jgi:plastocyanin
MRIVIRTAFVGLSLAVVAGCSGGEKKGTDAAAPAAAAPAATLPVEATPAPGGQYIEIMMTTDDKGSYFKPNEVHAKVGDVLRFKLAIGVHNVDFLADSNPGKSGLPPVSGMLQLPGQTQDILLSFGTGKFYFQCDPHAALGMHGRVEVEAR